MACTGIEARTTRSSCLDEESPPDASASRTASSPSAARPYAGPTSLRAAGTLADFDALIEEAIRQRAEKVKEETETARTRDNHRMAALGGELISLAREDGSDLAPLVDEMVARLARLRHDSRHESCIILNSVVDASCRTTFALYASFS